MDDRFVGKLTDTEVFPVDSSTSGSVKRSRTPSSGTQVASCLVDGCISDLSRCREYHRRHKVCELHSKTPRVMIRGEEKRFCQQCSRFHSLGEFDEGKRSCRKRLDGHNRRRRKSQTEPLAINSGRLLTGYQGARFLAFDPPQMLARGPSVSSAWVGSGKAENDFALFNSQSQFILDGRNVSIPETLCDEGERQFLFLEGTNSTFDGYSAREHNVCSNLRSANAGSSQKAFPNGLNRVYDSDCALSLLSSTPAETREVGLRHVMQPNGIPPARSLIPSLQLDDIRMESESSPVAHTQCSSSSTIAKLNCQGMFHIGLDEASSSGAPHKLFAWE